ncbi:DMT family transporter [Oceanobacillus jeddahense]|uniref:DMT family transporter n=1 Tax=Oceanobacillus jeddahense TaxID=1462527 RepID=UPI000595BC17|nr:SMR family transporter [Oceanobacillus jeddahense]
MGAILLTISILFSIIANVFVKQSQGFKNKTSTVLAFLFFAFCIFFLTLSVQYMEIGIAYAIWCGVVLTAITLIGIIFFQESKNKVKLISIFITLIGVILLQLQS